MGIKTLASWRRAGRRPSARLGATPRGWPSRGGDLQPLVPKRPRSARAVARTRMADRAEPLLFVLTRLLEPLATPRAARSKRPRCTRARLRDERSAYCGVSLVVAAARCGRWTLMPRIRIVPAGGRHRSRHDHHRPRGRVLQHALFTRAHPTPDQLSTLVARLGALMGQDRIGAPAIVDSYRPGAFEMRPFLKSQVSTLKSQESFEPSALRLESSDRKVVSALRRCRQPVPARVRMDAGSPRDVTTDRRGFAGGTVLQSAGPWHTSGNWWAGRNSEFRIQNSEFQWNRRVGWRQRRRSTIFCDRTPSAGSSTRLLIEEALVPSHIEPTRPRHSVFTGAPPRSAGRSRRRARLSGAAPRSRRYGAPRFHGRRAGRHPPDYRRN